MSLPVFATAESVAIRFNSTRFRHMDTAVITKHHGFILDIVCFFEGGFCVRSFSHELKNMTGRATVMMELAVLNTMGFLRTFSRLSQNDRQQ